MICREMPGGSVLLAGLLVLSASVGTARQDVPRGIDLVSCDSVGAA